MSQEINFKEDKNKIILDCNKSGFNKFLFQRNQSSKESTFKMSAFKEIQRSQHSKKSTFIEVNILWSHNLGIVEKSRVTRIKKIKSLESEWNLEV